MTNLDLQINPGRVISANCEELSERGQTENGLYWIQPTMEVEPFQVSCIFDQNATRTVIEHNKSEKEITSTPGQPDDCEGKNHLL